MAIFGAGSNWNSNEKKNDFFRDDNFIIGWDYINAKDLYDGVSLLKTGDIIYLKANQVGARKLRIKGIGVVTQTFVHCLIEKGLTKELLTDWKSFYIKVKWIYKDEFKIIIPKSEGRLTNIRAATFYEENLPFVQKEIIEKLFKINL